MSEQEEQAAIGRMVQEYAAAKKKLATLETEAAAWGRTLELIARCLQNSPEAISVDGQSLPPRYRRSPCDSEHFNVAKLKALGDDVRREKDTIERLEPQLKVLGIPIAKN